MLETLPDDSFQQVIDACGDGLPLFEAVKGLGCLSKALLQQLHRLRPLVGVKSLAVVQRPAHGPWRVMLLHKGSLTAAVVEQARRGRVLSINMQCTTLAPAVARRVVPELLGTGSSLFELDMSCVKLDGTWASTFGVAVVCSPVLRKLRLEGCGLQGPLPELRLPALQMLHVSLYIKGGNQLTGGLDSLRSCTALQELFLEKNFLTGGLEPLRFCTALQALRLSDNQIKGGLEPLRGCTALLALHMSNNQVTGGLEPLRGCTALSHFTMNNNQLTGDLDALRGCTALEELHLQGNALTGELDPLRGCTALQDLWMDGNQLTGGLEPLRHCTALHTICLSNNRLTGGLEPLRGNTGLDQLHLDNNRGLTGGIEPIRDFTLNWLSLENTQLVLSGEDKARFEEQCEEFSC